MVDIFTDVFFGSLVGLIVMGLMAALREPELHEVHVYCDEDGNVQIMTFPVEDKIIWHKEPENIKALKEYAE